MREVLHETWLGSASVLLGYLLVGIASGYVAVRLDERDNQRRGRSVSEGDRAGLFFGAFTMWPVVWLMGASWLAYRGLARPLMGHAVRTERARYDRLRDREEAVTLRERRIEELERELGIVGGGS